ncbi:MAG: geranylgeranylglyceryl/heptaprenylglyceryl phosphate synthase [Bacteroidota bacterium]
MNETLLKDLQTRKASGQKSFAMLLDPDKTSLDTAERVVLQAEKFDVDWLLVGGSLLHDDHIRQLIPYLKSLSKIPVILFPGSPQQVVPSANGILFLSLISGRNPDLLIGRHVEAAPLIRNTKLEVLPTGYMLIDCGKPTTAHYMSGTQPIPYDKADIAACTAMAGEMLGLKLIYMDGGSGASQPISPNMIQAVSQNTDIPLIVGGGIRSAAMAEQAWSAGADLIVVGNALERDPDGELLNAIMHVKVGMGASV